MNCSWCRFSFIIFIHANYAECGNNNQEWRIWWYQLYNNCSLEFRHLEVYLLAAATCVMFYFGTNWFSCKAEVCGGSCRVWAHGVPQPQKKNTQTTAHSPNVTSFFELTNVEKSCKFMSRFLVLKTFTWRWNTGHGLIVLLEASIIPGLMFTTRRWNLPRWFTYVFENTKMIPVRCKQNTIDYFMAVEEYDYFISVKWHHHARTFPAC